MKSATVIGSGGGRLVVLAGLAVVHWCPSSSIGQEKPAKIVVDGSTTVGPIAKAFLEYYRERYAGVEISVSESGSGNGVKSLINGTCDIAAMSRFMTDREYKAALDKGEMPVAHAVALDGIAMVVHPSNRVENLTLDQIRSIYTGRVSNWKEVGGADARIVKVSRDTNSGTYESFHHLVMRDAQMAPDTEKVGSNGAVRQRVESTAGAIGFVSLGFVDRSVKSVAVNGVGADRDSVVTGRYPIARPLFFFTNGYPKLGSHLHRFVTLYLTPDGEERILELGFVPVTSYSTEQARVAKE